MRVLRSYRFALLAFVAPLVASVVAADEPSLVTASRSIRIAMVDTGVKATWREDLNRDLGQTLCAAMERQAGAGFAATIEMVDARTAAARFARRACDAVVILGPERPRAFRRMESPMVAATCGADRNFEPAYLIVAGADAALRRTLHESFSAATRRIEPRPAANRVATSERSSSRSQD